jgi:UDP-N-acetylmuramate--alanine ligase
MSGLAVLLVEMGWRVSGSDASESPVLDELRRVGVEVKVGHDALFNHDANVVLWSPAIAPDNPELLAARDRGATMLNRAQVLSELAKIQPVIGLTGTHGKTTATSMMVHVMYAAGRDESRLLGASVTGVGANGHWGSGSLVLEVDESYGTFSLLAPYALGLLNVEADHLDHYGTLEALEDAFAQLLARTTGPVVAWSDDLGVRRVTELSRRDVVFVGTSRDVNWKVDNVVLARHGSSFSLSGPQQEIQLELNVTGNHNVANAAVVAVLALNLGVSVEAIVNGLSVFVGAPRRFQLLGRWRGVDVFEDYAHLPGEIVASARSIGYERITAVFQPHRVSRTLNLAPHFADAFLDASTVIVTDIYTAGEGNPEGVTGELIASQIRLGLPGATSIYAPTFRDVLDVLESHHDDSDVILLLGAGDVASVAAQLSGGLG